MQGHFDIKLLNAGSYTDEDFMKAKEEGRLLEMLNGLQVKQRVDKNNLIDCLVDIKAKKILLG